MYLLGVNSICLHLLILLTIKKNPSSSVLFNWLSPYKVCTIIALQKTSGAAAEDAGGRQEKKTIWGAETEAEAAQQCQTQGESLSTSFLFYYFSVMSTAHLCNPLGSWCSIVLYSDRRKEPWWCLGGNQRQPGWLQQRREDAPHSIITDQEARYLHLNAFRCNPWDFFCCASPSADLLPVALLKCLLPSVIVGLEAGQHDGCPAGSQTSQNYDFQSVYILCNTDS